MSKYFQTSLYSATKTSVAGEWRLNYEERFYNELFRLTFAQEALVPGEKTNAYIVSTATDLHVPFRKGLMNSTKIQYDRDNDPLAGVVKDDRLYALKLRYKW